MSRNDFIGWAVRNSLGQFSDHYNRAIEPYVNYYSLTALESNAAKHTAVAAIYTNWQNAEIARALGYGNELAQNLVEFALGDSVGDDLKDLINNEIGIAITENYPNLSDGEYYQIASFLAKHGNLYINYNNKGLGQWVESKCPYLDDVLKEVVNDFLEGVWGPSCFPAHIPITLADGSTKPIADIRIADIRIGDEVLSFQPDGSLVSGTVTRLLENVTTEWVKLKIVGHETTSSLGVSQGSAALASAAADYRVRPDNDDGGWELARTPGVSTKRASFAAIADIIADDGRIVLTDA